MAGPLPHQIMFLHLCLCLGGERAPNFLYFKCAHIYKNNNKATLFFSLVDRFFLMCQSNVGQNKNKICHSHDVGQIKL